MLLRTLSFIHYFTTMLFGIYISAFFLGGETETGQYFYAVSAFFG